MYDKTVRRRRAVLGLLVVSSLILLTAYFGESGGGALHGVQRGTSEVLNPVQEGASRALKPVRDLFGWFGDTLAAKGKVEDLTAERDRLRGELAVRDNATYENQIRPRCSRPRARSARPVRAEDGARDLAGSDRLVRDDPRRQGHERRGPGGSAGDERAGADRPGDRGLRRRRAGDAADRHDVERPPARAGRAGVYGQVEPVGAGNPNDLLLKYARPARLNPGDRVVTRGTVAENEPFASLYPAGLPIGVITRIDNEGTDTQEVHLRPYADMRSLDFVRILTQPRGSGA